MGLTDTSWNFLNPVNLNDDILIQFVGKYLNCRRQIRFKILFHSAYITSVHITNGYTECMLKQFVTGCFPINNIRISVISDDTKFLIIKYKN